MGQELKIPDSFRGLAPAQAFAALNAADDNLAEGIGQSYGVIGYKGKTWTLRYRGEKRDFIRPDDRTPISYLDVVILANAKGKSKSYYPGGFKEGSAERPTCASVDGIVPDQDVLKKQNDNCALCPMNQWKTDAATGRKGRECTDYKRLAVLVMPYLTTPILGSPLVEPVFLRVPPDSLTSLAIMGETMANQGFHYSTYITRIKFDPNKAHPSMIFEPLQGLTDNEAPVIIQMRSDPITNRIIGDGSASQQGARAVAMELAKPGTTNTGLGSLASSVGQTALVASSSASGQGRATTQEVSTSLSGLGDVQRATQSQIVVSTPSSGQNGLGVQSGMDTGLTGALSASGSAAQNPAQGTLVTGSSSDAGEPEDSDEDLDARIAAMIKTQRS